jgi:hypothetical protein
VSIETRRREKVIYENEIVSVTCTRCGETVEPLHPGDVKLAPQFPFDGGYVRGLVRDGMGGVKVEASFEFCAACMSLLTEWVADGADPEKIYARMLEQVDLEGGGVLEKGTLVTVDEWPDEGETHVGVSWTDATGNHSMAVPRSACAPVYPGGNDG